MYILKNSSSSRQNTLLTQKNQVIVSMLHKKWKIYVKLKKNKIQVKVILRGKVKNECSYPITQFNSVILKQSNYASLVSNAEICV